MLGLIAAVLTAAISQEVLGQTGALSRAIVRAAVQRVPFNEHDAYLEMWESHLNDCPGPISKLRHAIGCWIIADKLRLADLTWTDYAALHLFGAFGLALTLSSKWHTAKASLMSSVASAVERLGAPQTRVVLAQSAIADLREYAAEEQMAGVCFRLLSAAGRRVQMAELRIEHAEFARSVVMAFGVCLGSKSVNACRHTQIKVAAIRRALGIHVKPRVVSPSDIFDKYATVGETMEALFEQLGEALKKLKRPPVSPENGGGKSEPTI